jgi:predicted GNAT family N-acyltransferase
MAPSIPVSDGSQTGDAPLRVDVVDESWERDAELAELLYRELYRDFGVARSAEWRHAEPGSVTLVALDEGGGLLGSARLLPHAGDASRQVRQVTVSRIARGMGVGRALMAAVEEHARTQGAIEIWLNARECAVGFYERLGYERFGNSFVSELTGIPHVAMRKALPSAG